MKTFVVGTGRCGTVTVTELLNRSPHIKAGHEVPPVLIREATQYANGELPHNIAVDLLRRSYDEFDVVVNHKFSTMIPAIKKAYPDAKFVWMIRRAAPFVASFVARGLYADPGQDVWKNNLLDWRAEDSRVTCRIWELMTQVDKCAWYWAHVNKIIHITLPLGDRRQIRIPIESLSSRAGELFDFVGIPLPEDTEPDMLNRTVPGMEVNLTKEEHKIIDYWTGDLMERYYGE
jgi:hypothetical protein